MTDLRKVHLPRLAPGVVMGETLMPYIELLVRDVLSKADVRNAIGQGITISADGNVVATLDATGAIDDAILDHVAAANPHPTYLTQAEGDALYESDLGNPGVNGHVLTSTIAGVRSWAAAGAASHNTLSGLQGGAASEYYHLTALELAGLPTHAEPLTDGIGGFVFDGTDIVVVVGVPN